MHSRLLAVVLSMAVLSFGNVLRADSIESLTGNVIEGKILSRDDKFVVMEVKVAGKPVQRKYGISLIRAITIDGQREVLKEGGAPGKTPSVGAAPKVGVGGGGPEPHARGSGSDHHRGREGDARFHRGHTAQPS